MHYKPRSKPTEIPILEHLRHRMDLPQKSRQYYTNLLKGYEGELQFDSLTEQLQSDVLILNDLLLKENNTAFQIDSLIITTDAIYIYEIKHYDGDYYYDMAADQFYKAPQIVITNPLHQLNRSETLLTQLLRKHGFHIPIRAFVVFISNGFTLYQAPMDKPILHPNQVKRHLHQLDKGAQSLSRQHRKLADKLLSLNISESPYTQLPAYEYHQLQKGITCSRCKSFSVYIEGRNLICSTCAHKENPDTAVMRSVREFQLLFPNRKVTTSEIMEWCQIESAKKIRRILDKNMRKQGTNRGTFYR